MTPKRLACEGGKTKIFVRAGKLSGESRYPLQNGSRPAPGKLDARRYVIALSRASASFVFVRVQPYLARGEAVEDEVEVGLEELREVKRVALGEQQLPQHRH